MENEKYKTPAITIIIIEVEQALLASSFTGEGINEWEDI